MRFAFLGYDSIAPWYAAGDEKPGTAPLSAESVRQDVSAARALADHVVVGAGWGVEYTADPIASQREIGGIAIEAGASFVMGNHPHWVQAVEHFDGEHGAQGALVAYSFGNFVFDQRWSVATTQGMLMELGFTSERLIGYRIRPVVIRAHSSATPLELSPRFRRPRRRRPPNPRSHLERPGPPPVAVARVGSRDSSRSGAAEFTFRITLRMMVRASLLQIGGRGGCGDCDGRGRDSAR